jgi:hypothetical protein
LKIVGPPPADLASAIIEEFRPTLTKHEMDGSRLKLKFMGYPWHPSAEETVKTRIMLLKLLACLERFGFSVYSSIDAENGHDGEETDVLICHRQRNWVPGAPVWHR